MSGLLRVAAGGNNIVIGSRADPWRDLSPSSLSDPVVGRAVTGSYDFAPSLLDLQDLQDLQDLAAASAPPAGA